MPIARPVSALALLSLIASAGCGASAPFHPSTPADVAAAGSPLGPSYILVPLPNDDDALLGRVLLDVPENGRSLDEVSRPNECASNLTPKKEGPLASTFEDAQELAGGGKARAALGVFGFEGDAKTATHFYYKLEVSKRIAQSDTTEYVACCKEKGTCGYGFISALVYGDGQYATAAETSADASVSIPVAGGASGFVKVKVLHRRNVRGYVAALVTITDPAKSKGVSVMGDPAAVGISVTEQSLPEQVKARFESQKVWVDAKQWAPVEFAYVFKDGNGDITENEFIERYRTMTGSDQLEAAKHTDGGKIAGGVGLMVLGGSIIALGVYLFALPDGTTSQGSPDQGKKLGGSLLGGLSVLPLIGGGALIASGLSPDPSSHRISKFDADLYVARYNRALLRKTVQDTQTRMRELSGKNTTPVRVMPVLSPGFVGMTGTF